MGRVRIVFTRVANICLIFLILFALIELCANFYLWNIASEEQFNYYASISQIKQRYGNDYYTNIEENKNSQFQPHHYLGYTNTYNYKTDVDQHDKFGFRGDEMSFNKPDGIYRIVAIGSSETYGSQVENATDAYPSLLEEYLHNRGYTNIEVVNAGVNGYTSHEVLINLQFRVLDLDPDLILIYQNSTDVNARFVLTANQYLGDNSGYRTSLITDIVSPEIWEYSTVLRIVGLNLQWIDEEPLSVWSRFRQSSSTYDAEFRAQYRAGTYPSGVFKNRSAMDMLLQNPPTYFERNLRSMIAISRANGADTLLMTYISSSNFDNVRVQSEEYQFGTTQQNEVIRRVAQETDNHLVDIAEEFPLDDKYFVDGQHMTREGYLVFAQILGDYMIQNILDE